MKLKFGPAVSSLSSEPEKLIEYLTKALEFSNEAIELSLVTTDRIFYDARAVSLLRKFKYRSIHLPVLDASKKVIIYPDPKIFDELGTVDRYISEISPQTVLVHPDQISDFDWLAEKYGDLLAFENLDAKKIFGKTVADLNFVFKKCPKAKLVLDLNHVYTNDESMALADDIYQAFKTRLCHFHLSGYGGFHDALCLSQENVIVKGLVSLDYPIIDEGNLMERDLLKTEFDYVCELLLTKPPTTILARN